MADNDTVRVLVEIPKESRNKYELKQETGEIELDRRLFAAVTYRPSTASSRRWSLRTATSSTR